MARKPVASPSFETRPSDAPQRLCWKSSGLPWFVVPDDGVEYGQEFSSYRDQCNHCGFAGGAQALMEGAQRGVPAHGGHRRHEQHSAHAGTATADEALAAPLAGLAREWCDADQGCNLATIEAAQFRKLRQHGTHR